MHCVVNCFGWKHSGPVGTNWRGLVLSNNSRSLSGREGEMHAVWHLHEGKLVRMTKECWEIMGIADEWSREKRTYCESGFASLHAIVTERMIEWRVACRCLSKLKVSKALTSSLLSLEAWMELSQWLVPPRLHCKIAFYQWDQITYICQASLAMSINSPVHFNFTNVWVFFVLLDNYDLQFAGSQRWPFSHAWSCCWTYFHCEFN